MSAKGYFSFKFLMCVGISLTQFACGDGESNSPSVSPGTSAGTGGALNAGEAGEGGTPTGDAGEGGNGDTGEGGSPVGGRAGSGGGGTGGTATDCSVELIVPEEGTVLSEADDANQNCEDGFQVTVQAITSGGGEAELLLDGSLIGTEDAGRVTRFEDVSLNTNASNELTVRVGECSDTVRVTTQCEGVPTCQILSPAGTTVNGGARTSPDGAPYALEVSVGSNIPNGELVSLTVDGVENAAAAFVNNGQAVFSTVPLAPDGPHTLSAVCHSGTGKRGQSAQVQLVVDSQAPDLTVVNLQNGQHFSAGDDVDSTQPDLQFDVCGVVEASDAVAPGRDNFCVGIGAQGATCFPTSADGAPGNESGGCARLTCPGSAPFDLTISVEDAAGNRKEQTVSGVTCASARPSVQIMSPADGSSILGASMPAPHDENASASGAQVSVVACTNSTAGTGRLLAGLAGGSLSSIATSSVEEAEASDNCPAGLTHVVRFAGATLPESLETATGALVSRTQLQVQVTDQSTEVGESGNVNLWVDSLVPTVAVIQPSRLCGETFQATAPLPISLRFSVGSKEPLSVTVTPNGAAGVTETFVNSGIVGSTETKAMTFAVGTNEVAATITEPSGNVGTLKAPCTVTVGNPPVVSWTNPTLATRFGVSSDADPNAPGWQGDLTVKVTNIGSGGEVQFSANGTDLGGPVAIQSDGTATLAGATIPEGASVTLRATTSDEGEGAGSAAIGPFAVDVTVPDAVADVTPTVQHRRQTTFRLTWPVPADGDGVPSSYDVRVGTQPITEANFDTMERVFFNNACTGNTACTDVRDRLIERDYYFAVAALDAAGNRGPIGAAGPSAARFNTTILTGQEAAGSDERFGLSADGSASLNGDAYADLVVGSLRGNKVYIWFGSETGYAAAPNVTISGPAGVEFGRAVSVVGDIDSDGLNDIAIGAPSADGARGRVYILRGRSTWPSTIQAETEADTIVTAASATSFNRAYLGASLARLGDFNNDGHDDFAVSAYNYDDTRFVGFVAVILGAPNSTTGWDLPATISLPEDLGTHALGIAGDPTLTSGALGWSVLGLGGFYGASTGDTLVAAAALGSRVYAFAGRNGDANGNIPIASADGVFTGAASTRFGNSLALVGSFAGRPAIAIGNPRLNTGGSSGRVFVHFGSPSGPFAGPVTEIRSSAFTGTNRFGYAVLGSGVSGTSVTGNLIGNASGDLALTGDREAGGAASIYLMSGETVRAKSGTVVDAATDAEVVFRLSTVSGLTGWRGTSTLSSTIQDSNGDGFADLAIGETDGTANAPAYDGRIVVIW